MNRFFNAGFKATSATLNATNATVRSTKVAASATADAGRSFMAGVRAAINASKPQPQAAHTNSTGMSLAKY